MFDCHHSQRTPIPVNRPFALLALLLVAVGPSLARVPQQAVDQDEQFWELSGTDAIVWDLTLETKLPHSDNIEMDGQRVAAIIHYEVDTLKTLKITRDIIFPQLRIFPESSANRWRKYRAYLREEYSDELLPTLTLEDRTFEPGPVDSVQISGMIRFYHAASQGLVVERTLLPSMTERLFVEGWRLTNVTAAPKRLRLGKTDMTREQEGQNGTFIRRVYTDREGTISIEPGETIEFAVHFAARFEAEPPVEDSFDKVLRERRSFLDSMDRNLVLETPDRRINTLFHFSKIRAAESIYDTIMGLVHSPGGGRYYTGVWANDQAEYSGPFFPYLGYENGNRAALNAYRKFLENIPEGEGNFWSSFEMEGTVTCCGGDRGDAAMIAFGASHWALATGSQEEAAEIWPLIEWSLDYSHRHMNEHGVIDSDSDEMEGRIETGGANLATSALYFGALKQSALLATALGQDASVSAMYEQQAADLRQSMETYFGAEIEGLRTYQYFDGHPFLRHWISLPLVMGIDDRREGTLDALFSKLWTNNGVKVEHNPSLEEPNLFWDRGTLYAFRGAFKAGAANRTLQKLRAYSGTRLLGFHVPYVVEAWPEGNMAHLSAESALYCRIFTEGVLGITPTGFRSFEMSPNIPDDWDYFNLKNIHAFGSSFDVLIARVDGGLETRVVESGRILLTRTIRNGERVVVRLDG
jgi:hypothetical protein